jgi:hypothetical protein
MRGTRRGKGAKGRKERDLDLDLGEGAGIGRFRGGLQVLQKEVMREGEGGQEVGT